MTPEELERFFDRELDAIIDDPGAATAHETLLAALEAGDLRAASPLPDGSWHVNAWIKRAILVGFRRTSMSEVTASPAPNFDKTAYPVRRFALEDGVRLVPGGSAVRRGAHVARGVVIMPPAYVNVGAFVGEGSMIDSHALVGSCAQIGARVHLSAGAQVGGVLEPVGATPVVVEDEVFVGGLAGLFDGVLVRRRAVIAAGVILTGSTVLYDLVRELELRREVPSGAVVVPGSRAAGGAFAKAHGISLSTPVVVKYRDAKTDAATALEAAVR